MNEVRLRLLRAGGDPAGADDDPMSSSALMVRTSRGDENAFGLLYDRLAPLVFGIVQRVVRDPSISEEVSQEVFVELWRIAPRFEPDRGSVEGWAATVAHRKAVDRVRSEQSRRDREDREHLQGVAAASDSIGESLERASDRAKVEQALSELTEAQREAVKLAYFGGHTYRQVAILLDLPEGTVKTRIRDGMSKLRDMIGDTE